MIPLHRPSFGIGTVISAALFLRRSSQNLWRLEEAYAAGSGCAEAVWLPSARAGIAWALRSSINSMTKVLGPAYTCSVVHDAMVRSGGRATIIDAASDSFEMQPQALRAEQRGDYALVLSEAFGHTYDLERVSRGVQDMARMRIIDSAMSIPHPALFQRLQENDFAVISFGTAKSMYAGWGAVGLTRNATFGKEVRKIRDTMLARAGFNLTLQRAISAGLRTAVQYPSVFSLARKVWYQGVAARSLFARLRRKPARQPRSASASPSYQFPAAWLDEQRCGKEWRRPSTYVDRNLALRNLESAGMVHAKRLTLAARYHADLSTARGVVLPPVSQFALSSYTVRVNAEIRNRVQRELSRHGVHTRAIWPFSPYLNPQEFPNAFRTSSEVLSLPLYPWMSLRQVDEVCRRLVDAIE